MRFGKWDTLEELDRGGQGVVYLALDTQKVDIGGKILPTIQRTVIELGQIRPLEDMQKSGLQFLQAIEGYFSRRNPKNCGALKVLHEEIRKIPKAYARLEREAAALSGRDHPHVVKLLESDVSSGWFVMEYFPLGSLEKHPNRFRGRALEALLAIRPLVEAVTTLHAEGITHRDIAPKNVFCADRGLVLGDFGLVYPGAEGRVSETYENVGSRDWMPPWAMGSRQDPSPAFDVFTLGKLLWAMVAGRHMLRLWYFRHSDFNLEVIFPGVAEMAEINALLDRCVVEKEEQCLPSAQEMLEVVDATIARLRGARPTATATPVDLAEADELTKLGEWLESDSADVRIDAARELANLAGRKRIFPHEGLRSIPRKLLKDSSREVRLLALEVVGAIVSKEGGQAARYYSRPLTEVVEQDTDLDVRARAVATIGNSGDVGFLDQVCDWIAGLDQTIYMRVWPIAGLLGLARSDRPRVIEELRRRIERASSDAQRARFVEALNNVRSV